MRATSAESAGGLSAEEREDILVGLSRGESMSSIARQLDRAPSTVTREVAANGAVYAFGDARYAGGAPSGQSVVAITATEAFRNRNFRAAAARASSPPGHFPGSSELAAASCRATNALMLATVIFRERPSL